MSVQAFHQAQLEAGRWLIQHCGGCARHVYFPRESTCPHCGAQALAWVTPAGTGAVYATTTVRRRPADGGDLNVCIVELDEGVRLMSRVDNRTPSTVRIGQRVRARLTQANGHALVVFDVLDTQPTATAVTASPGPTP